MSLCRKFSLYFRPGVAYLEKWEDSQWAGLIFGLQGTVNSHLVELHSPSCLCGRYLLHAGSETLLELSVGTSKDLRGEPTVCHALIPLPYISEQQFHSRNKVVLFFILYCFYSLLHTDTKLCTLRRFFAFAMPPS